MPPPPPPSKSYSIVFDDTDSEDESESEVYRSRGHAERAPIVLTPQIINSHSSEKKEEIPSTLAMVAQATKESTTSGKQPRANMIEDDDDSSGDAQFDGDEQQQGMTKNQKKNKRRRKRKKNKRSDSQQLGKSVSFSDVKVREFRRSFGLCSVPGDGAWPLGMDMDDYQDSTVPLEEWESETQARLHERWERVKQKCSEDTIRTMTHRPAKGIGFKYETRQWDYKQGPKNPLFRILCEDERRDVLLESSNAHLSDDEASSDSSSNAKMVADNHYNEEYTQQYVLHVRHELEEIRNFRSKDTATGCNCRKLTVYIPPKNGGGKKAQHRRLKPAKLVQELRKRGLYDDKVHPKKSREFLEKLLHDAVEKEPCCWGSDCFCIRNGINCQADSCSCWHDSHVHAKSSSKASGSYVGVEEIKSRCGSSVGMYVVDLDEIDAYRKNVLVCMPCK